MEGLKIAGAVWPLPIVLVAIFIVKNETLGPIMQTAFYLLLGVSFVVAAFIMLSRLFSDPPDLGHPD
jgi:hypothetical protein